jgi:hypothetical protein
MLTCDIPTHNKISLHVGGQPNVAKKFATVANGHSSKMNQMLALEVLKAHPSHSIQARNASINGLHFASSTF